MSHARNTDALLREISMDSVARESECVERMLPFLAPFEERRDEIMHEARAMLTAMRNSGAGVGLETFLAEYSLSEEEGAAIMCLAEALLRIPDKDTANKLVESALTGASWEKQLNQSESFFINATGWGLLVAGKTLSFGKGKPDAMPSMLRGMTLKYGADVVRGAVKKAMHFGAGQFVVGQDVEAALKRAQKSDLKHYRFSYDMLGEAARTAEQAEEYFAAYMHVIRKAAAGTNEQGFARPGISIKLSALHPRYELLQKSRAEKELYPKLKALALEAKALDISVSVDAEEAARLDLELELFVSLCRDPDLQGYNGLGFVLQAYQKRAWKIISLLCMLAEEGKRRIPVRLVKGAYWDTEIKIAQINGLVEYPVFTNKHHSDLSYLACARRLLDAGAAFYPQFATHNAHTIAAIRTYSPRGDYEFQRLYGMGERLYDALSRRMPCRIYAPVGEHKDLLAYLIRRLLENGANSSFVNMAANKKVPVEQVLQDPVAKTRAGSGKRNATLPLPKHIFGEARDNPPGPDWGSAAQMQELRQEVDNFLSKTHRAGAGMGGKNIEIREPADKKCLVGHAALSTESDVRQASAAALAAYPAWGAVSVGKRAEILRRTSDAIEKNRGEILALLTREAGKTIKDAVAEWREAIDFCRYYAAEACRLMAEPILLPGPTGESNALSLHPRGMFVCVSPWNFPLAIFIGQIAAALAAGNSVLAKPAPQTPLIADYAAQLFYKSGLPKDALRLVFGGGDIGAQAINAPGVAGVCFTGSTRAAKEIAKALAAKDGAIVPLIAETGGLNVMVADGSALPEQLADDVIASAFGSAGQRCSALRLLFLPEQGAAAMLAAIAGAAKEIAVGDPRHFSTDVGPVIDADARERLLAWESALQKSGAELLAKAPLPPACKKGYFVAPQIWSLPDPHLLTEERFGPILHVTTYKKFEEAIAFANNTGYGLTFGLHSRIRDRYKNIHEKVRAGNIYVNRNMTGAVVGSQPFGGENMSGTGFKAGGPNYLRRFLHERTLTINTAAIGGNAELLARG